MTSFTIIINHGGTYDKYRGSISGGRPIKNYWHSSEDWIYECITNTESGETVWQSVDKMREVLKYRAADFPFTSLGIDRSKIGDDDTIWAEIIVQD